MTTASSPLVAHDIFLRTLDSVSSFNPFGAPCIPPGLRAQSVEQQTVSLEDLHARSSGLPQFSLNQANLRRQTLGALKRILARTTLLHHERSVVLAAIAGFLDEIDRAASAQRPTPDLDLFIDALRRVLVVDFLLPDPDVRLLLQDIRALAFPARQAA